MQICVNQKSGLGNQLFQYVAGRYFAERYGASLTVVREPARLAQSHGYARPFLLTEFALRAAVRERGRVDRLLCSTRSPLTRVLQGLTGTQVIREAQGHQWRYEPELAVKAGTRRLYLEGYWQVHQYAAAMERELRDELRWVKAAAGADRAMLERIETGSGTAVSLHVRRGDYTLAAEGSPALAMTYYARALEAIHARVADPVFYVFSDDMAYARGHLPAAEKLVFVDHNGDQTAHEDLRLMAACRHHVIANSSFSWWGAWLNPRADKVVVAPAGWTDPKLAPRDLLPPDWVRISS